MSEARIVVCHRSWLFAECLATSLRQCRSGWECLAVAANAVHATWAQLVPAGIVDLLVVDPTLADHGTTEVIDIVRQHHLHCRVVFLVSDAALDRVVQLTDHRCDGWIFDQVAAVEVAAAIDTVLAGRRFCSPQVACAFVDSFRNGGETECHVDRPRVVLTVREDGR